MAHEQEGSLSGTNAFYDGKATELRGVIEAARWPIFLAAEEIRNPGFAVERDLKAEGLRGNLITITVRKINSDADFKAFWETVLKLSGQQRAVPQS